MSENSLPQISLESRVSFLEAKVKELELRLSRIENPTATVIPSALPKPANVQDKRISVTVLNKNFHQADYSVGDSGDRIDFSFQFTSHLSKDIRAFTGEVVFKDLFERVIIKIRITDEGGIRSGGMSQWKGGMEYNQFLEEHKRLLIIEKNDLIAEFLVGQVIYSDGTREDFSQ